MNQLFAQDLYKGLCSDPKHIPSKYFYDEAGSKIFQEIMHLEEYYLFDCELEIFQTYKSVLLKHFAQDGEPFDLIEFGAGDGFKTKVLLENFLEAGAKFRYTPVDISPEALEGLSQNLREKFPDLAVKTLPYDYFQALDKLSTQSTQRKVILFLGSNIGNFHYDAGIDFLAELRGHLNPGDLLLMGMDLKKNPKIILDAYNDRQGVTRTFNLNLLHRVNREMDADFNIAQFEHYPVYNPIEGGAKSYLMSRIKQKVRIKKIDLEIVLEPWEAIYTESSYKYTPYQIQRMARKSGFEIVDNYFDKKNYYTNSLWKAL